MEASREQAFQAGLSPEQLTALSGLTMAVKPSALRFWQEAMPEGPETVPVAVASIEFDEAGQPVAIGIRRSEMLRTIEEHGDVQSNSARFIAIEPKRVIRFTPDGENTYSDHAVPKVQDGGDVFDAPYI